MKIVISSGHGKYVRGASGLIDEVDEARRVVPAVAGFVAALGHQVTQFHDNASTTQNQNLHTIVDFHNAQGPHDLDVSVHFNAYVPTDGGRGTECLYVSDNITAEDVARAVAAASGLTNRGAHQRTDLFFLNKTVAPAILIEVCFVDAASDVEAYEAHFEAICEAIAAVITNAAEPMAALELTGKVSWFGGPADQGVGADEPLAFIYSVDDQPSIFLSAQPPGTTGLARRLNPEAFYVACRWDYDITPRDVLLTKMAAVSAGGKSVLAYPADWGPHNSTGRVADVSPGVMGALDVETDDVVTVIFPAPSRE